MAQKNNKRLVASVVDFLNDELNNPQTTEDAKESIEVTIQCLKMAYNISEDAVPDSQKKLLDIFVEAVPDLPQKVLTEEDKAQAEQYKQLGNEQMKMEKFEDAITFYTQAIDVDANNAVYFCNRAAAYTGQNMFDLAIIDCKKALEIDPKYSKAYSRMGLTYSKVENYEKAVECYDEAIKLDPKNEGYKNNRQIAKEKMQANAGMPQMSLPGMGGGMPDLAGMMSNPMFMNMAQEAMQNPAMRQMAMSMMSNLMAPEPSAGGASGNSSDGADNPAGGGMPSMQQLLEMGQNFAQRVSSENPELVEQLRNQQNNQNDNNPST